MLQAIVLCDLYYYFGKNLKYFDFEIDHLVTG